MASAARDRIRSLAGNKAAQGIAATMMMKVGSAFVAFALFSLAARAAGTEEFGRFSMLFSILSILSIIAAAGQELQVVRAWNEYLADARHGLALGAVKFGWIISLLGISVVSVLITLFFFTFGIESVIPTEHSSGDLLLVSLAFLATNTLALYSSHVARASVGILVGDTHYELTWRSLAILFLAASMLLGHGVTTVEIMAVFALGLMLVIITQSYLIRRAIVRQIGVVKAQYATTEWGPRSARIWLAAVMEACNQHMEVFLIGLLLDPVAAGAYFVAARLANAFALAASGITTYGTRRVPSLYFSRDTEALKHILNLMAGMTLIIVVVGLLAVLFAGDYMLMIFGESYADYYWVLLILCIGTGMNAANGPAPSFLMLTGHEGRYMTIVTGSVILRVVGFFLVIPQFGISGAACVTASVMAGMAMLLNGYCRTMTGMDPSIFRFFLKSADTPQGPIDGAALATKRSGS